MTVARSEGFMFPGHPTPRTVPHTRPAVCELAFKVNTCISSRVGQNAAPTRKDFGGSALPYSKLSRSSSVCLLRVSFPDPYYSLRNGSRLRGCGVSRQALYKVQTYPSMTQAHSQVRRCVTRPCSHERPRPHEIYTRSLTSLSNHQNRTRL